ncbi:unnamed protein product [Clonostachys chloroleuca]|uniref:Uncharacterized protein n=1 Tax=Clonostachys chloroleuca TaxID=1926264 RepID=A0AA35M7T1_9HYPO|nr:unnamed protein product [Clonostachys chloroleuca]
MHASEEAEWPQRRGPPATGGMITFLNEQLAAASVCHRDALDGRIGQQASITTLAGRSQYHVDLGRLLQRLAPSMHCVLSRRQMLLVDRQLVAIGQDGLHHLHPAICKTISMGQSQSQMAISLPIPPYQAPATTCNRRQRIAASGGPLAITQLGGRNAVTLGILREKWAPQLLARGEGVG